MRLAPRWGASRIGVWPYGDFEPHEAHGPEARGSRETREAGARARMRDVKPCGDLGPHERREAGQTIKR
ncbi:hypothetical protein SAMN05216276_109717 [Streptosporangium subroseum]|uniref:Uncharacterized protein n=1 Tax=Streptosporangium subroseum TaxID=106412 RepID=A0A239P965_9ACTN|nr:hypothetical protein SAMN05216276_109717 [Streptosporangium subroseum]